MRVLKPHDFDGPHDARSVYVGHFAERLRHRREDGSADATCWRVARREDSDRIALDEREQAGAEEFLATRFEVRKSARRLEGLPVPMLVVK